MRFVADEGCDFSVVRALRAAGHDVTAILEISPRAEDTAIIDLAVREQCVLLTEDKDFGELVYTNARTASGVILIRFPGNARATLPTAIMALVNEKGEQVVRMLCCSATWADSHWTQSTALNYRSQR
jgi:predicted nuclease of predicted toxin-antitoxin system